VLAGEVVSLLVMESFSDFSVKASVWVIGVFYKSMLIDQVCLSELPL
jgi:hypothetical protein